MYKFYINKLNTSKELYTPYTVTEITTDPETKKEVEVTKVYETDDLSTLADKYKEMLSDYTTEQIKVVQELSPEILVNIND